MSRRLLVSRAPGPIRRHFATEPVVDYYAVLGVPPGATTKEIKAAFYSLSKKYHPDRNRDNQAEAASKFQQVSLAYEVLGSDEKRKMYDMTRIRTSPDSWVVGAEFLTE
ncbi:DnaJ domain protein [Cooperia oncophora]